MKLIETHGGKYWTLFQIYDTVIQHLFKPSFPTVTLILCDEAEPDVAFYPIIFLYMKFQGSSWFKYININAPLNIKPHKRGWNRGVPFASD